MKQSLSLSLLGVSNSIPKPRTPNPGLRVVAPTPHAHRPSPLTMEFRIVWERARPLLGVSNSIPKPRTPNPGFGVVAPTPHAHRPSPLTMEFRIICERARPLLVFFFWCKTGPGLPPGGARRVWPRFHAHAGRSASGAARMQGSARSGAGRGPCPRAHRRAGRARADTRRRARQGDTCEWVGRRKHAQARWLETRMTLCL